jgi:hypothetical protein
LIRKENQSIWTIGWLMKKFKKEEVDEWVKAGGVDLTKEQ